LHTIQDTSEQHCTGLEGSSRPAIKLPDIEPQVFDVLIDWLYTRKLLKKTRDWIAPTPGLEAGSHGHGQLTELLMVESYVFADRFLALQFRVVIYKYYAIFVIVAETYPITMRSSTHSKISLQKVLY
jgi:hypothetical protein